MIKHSLTASQNLQAKYAMMLKLRTYWCRSKSQHEIENKLRNKWNGFWWLTSANRCNSCSNCCELTVQGTGDTVIQNCKSIYRQNGEADLRSLLRGEHFQALRNLLSVLSNRLRSVAVWLQTSTLFSFGINIPWQSTKTNEKCPDTVSSIECVIEKRKVTRRQCWSAILTNVVELRWDIVLHVWNCAAAMPRCVAAITRCTALCWCYPAQDLGKHGSPDSTPPSPALPGCS